MMEIPEQILTSYGVLDIQPYIITEFFKDCISNAKIDMNNNDSLQLTSVKNVMNYQFVQNMHELSFYIQKLNQHKNDNQGNWNIEESQASNNERNNNMEHTVNDKDDETLNDITDEGEDTESNSTKSNESQRNTEQYYINDKNDNNEPNG